MAGAATDAGENLAQGETFSGALSRWPEVFPPLYLAMIRTGELTGKLDECCFKLATQQKHSLPSCGK
jgi:protein transport protein HofC